VLVSFGGGARRTHGWNLRVCGQRFPRFLFLRLPALRFAFGERTVPAPVTACVG
jgi:hypothetical protein